MVPHTGKSLRKANLGPGTQQIVQATGIGSRKVISDNSSSNMQSGKQLSKQKNTLSKKEITYTQKPNQKMIAG